MSDTTSHHIIIVTVKTDSQGRDTASAEWQGESYSATASNGAIFALCRLLVEAGCDDRSWIVPGRMSGTVHACAVRTITENPRCQTMPFTPHENSAPRPLLQVLLDRAAAARWLKRMRQTSERIA